MIRGLSYFAQFRALGTAQQRMLLVAWAWLPVFWLGLRVLGLSRFQVWLQRSTALPIRDSLAISDIEAFSRAVNIAARHTPFPTTCLTRSLLLNWMLRQRGISSTLRIGVRLSSGALYAHAWVERHGVPVNDRPDIATEFAAFEDAVPSTAFDRA